MEEPPSRPSDKWKMIIFHYSSPRLSHHHHQVFSSFRWPLCSPVSIGWAETLPGQTGEPTGDSQQIHIHMQMKGKVTSQSFFPDLLSLGAFVWLTAKIFRQVKVIDKIKTSNNVNASGRPVRATRCWPAATYELLVPSWRIESVRRDCTRGCSLPSTDFKSSKRIFSEFF